VALAARGDEHEPDPAGARHERLDHVQKSGHGDRGIDGVAAGQQHLDAAIEASG
jgi:hypothetical protein